MSVRFFVSFLLLLLLLLLLLYGVKSSETLAKQTDGRLLTQIHSSSSVLFLFRFMAPARLRPGRWRGTVEPRTGGRIFVFFFLLSKKKFSHFLSLSGHYRTKPSVDQRRSFLNSSLHGLAAAKQVALSSFFLSYLSSTFGAFFILRSLSDGFADKEKRRKGDIAFSFASLHSFFHSCLNSVLIESIRLE